MLRNLPIATDRLALLATGHVEPVVDWVEKDGRRQPGDQARDENTGLPLWQVHALVPIEDRPELVAVRVPAKDVPEVEQFSPVAFEHLVCRVTVNRSTGALTGYWSALGVADPKRPTARPQSEQPAA